ncbi:fimbria/pilus outer membrane usher protein [Entomohabitans teleogrylli]|uniref:fimbria/pilus outer membrane usher protein n=1 Tax=Entomohabitans teleogrylli TaxID=1384589 RepID=UPI00137ACD26|nr:fimbria/pilus outer membrane usher protein [Entomohabitans teleogrylli]
MPIALVVSSLAQAREEGEEVEFDGSLLRTIVDVSAFSRGNPVSPGSHRIDIYMNDRRKGRRDVTFVLSSPGDTSAIPCYDIKLLTLLGIAVDKLDKAALERLRSEAQCGDLSDIVPGATARFDTGSQRLEVRAPQILLQHEARGGVDPALWDHGVTAATLQYDYNGYRSEYSGSASQSSQYMSLRGGLNWRVWRLRYRANASWSNQQGFSYHSNQTYLERALTDWHSKLVLGQFTTEGQVFNSVGFLGAQLSSDDRMYADSRRGFAPVIQGVANTNALVKVTQGGYQIYETTVPPGPFALDDLYPTGSGGDLLVTVREADGREQVFTVPYASIPELLRPGVSRYSLNAGKYRNSAMKDEPLLGMATWQHGFSSLLTGYSGLITARDYTAVSGGLAFNTRMGAFSLGAIQSRTRLVNQHSRQGNSLRFTYAKRLPVTDTSLALTGFHYTGQGYYETDEAMLLRDRAKYPRNSISTSNSTYARRNRLQLNATQQLPERFGTFSLNANWQDYWNQKGTDTEYQVSYNNYFKRVNYGISLNRIRNLTTSRWENTVMLTFSIPLGSGPSTPNLTSSYTRQREQHSLQNSLSGSLGEDNQYRYGAFFNGSRHNNGDNATSVGGNVSWSAPWASLGGSYSTGSGYSQYGANLSGGVVAYQGGVVFTPMLGDTTAIVEAEHAGGARVTSYSGVRLNSRGKAVVPWLSPYRQNSVEIDPRGLSHDVELKYTSQNVVPTAGAVALLRYETESGHTFLVNSADINGKPLPFGATVMDEQQRVVGYIAQVGQGLLRTAKEQGTLTVKWGELPTEHCQFSYRIPVLSDTRAFDYPRLNATCQ